MASLWKMCLVHYETTLLTSNCPLFSTHTPAAPSRYGPGDLSAKSGEKWISKNVSFDIQDCTLPLHCQANVFAPGGTGAKLEKYKQHRVSVEDRRQHKIVWNETYVTAGCIRRTLEEPFEPAEMRSVANSAYCDNFTY